MLADKDGSQSFYMPGQSVPSTAERMEQYRDHARLLAIQAAKSALSRAAVDPSSITHLVTASCTGFDSPGPEQDLIGELGIPVCVRRTNIGFMGCHAAINALSVAEAFVRAEPTARVLICCVELCTLHLSHTSDPGRQVAHALFADGAAASVIANSSAAAQIRRTGSMMIPDSRDQMSWRVGDHGFEMSLSPQVPGTLARSVPPWIATFLASEGFAPGCIGSWAIHPGGPRLLSTLTAALELPHDACAISRDVLRRHGNMSSATVLFILEALLKENALKPILALAFGPGLAGEAVLLDQS